MRKTRGICQNLFASSNKTPHISKLGVSVMDKHTVELTKGDVILETVLKDCGINDSFPFLVYNIQSVSEIADSRSSSHSDATNFTTKKTYKIYATTTLLIFLIIIFYSVIDNGFAKKDLIGLTIIASIVLLMVLNFWFGKKFNSYINVDGDGIDISGLYKKWSEINKVYLLNTGIKQSNHTLILTLKNNSYIKQNVSGILNSRTNSRQELASAINNLRGLNTNP